MAQRVPPEVFYDRSIVGWTPGPTGAVGGWTTVEAIEADRFHRSPPSGDHGQIGHLAQRLARNATTFALVLLGVGFFAVFIKQAPIHLQIVFGAPVFEEFFKLGLALLLSAWMRFLVLRMVAALGVGAGFGVLEHFVTYSDEPFSLYMGRIAFHAGATALSMASYHVLESVPDVRARWASTLWASVLHYVNNSFALLSILPSFYVPAAVWPFALFVSSLVTVSLYVGIIWVLTSAARLRSWAQERVEALLA